MPYLTFSHACPIACKACVVAILVATFHHAMAAGELKPTAREDALTADQVINFYCDCAYFENRGIARSPFGKSADELILENLLKSKKLKTALKISEDQIDSIHNSVYRSLTGKAASSDERNGSADSSPISKALNATLSAEQLRDATIQYLNVEGFMALRRTPLSELIGVTPEDQNRIDTIIKKYAERARNLHGAIFTVPNNQLERLPKLMLELRTLSVKLDHEIANSLNDMQRQVLAETVITAAAPKYLTRASSENSSLTVLLANQRIKRTK